VDGKIYPVTKVLAANEKEDLAVVQLKGDGFQPLNVVASEGVGSAIGVIAHPRTQFFSFTRGTISRYYNDRNTGARLMSITADIAGGSSGGPVLNSRGDVVGIVSMTQSIAASNMLVAADSENGQLKAGRGDRNDQTYLLPLGHQMTVRICSSASAILDLMKEEG
ncbi:MAG: serine protease, partial [Verrucomicrobiota bacterium]